MADREMTVGESWPPLEGQASDSSGVRDLSVASLLEVVIDVGSALFIEPAAAQQPPRADPDGVHLWNWVYAWAPGDTATIGVGEFNVKLRVTWEVGRITIFDGPTLKIKPL